jgi:hypothetical protein
MQTVYVIQWGHWSDREGTPSIIGYGVHGVYTSQENANRALEGLSRTGQLLYTQPGLFCTIRIPNSPGSMFKYDLVSMNADPSR